jgi:hypothetical protein
MRQNWSKRNLDNLKISEDRRVRRSWKRKVQNRAVVDSHPYR